MKKTTKTKNTNTTPPPATKGIKVRSDVRAGQNRREFDHIGN